MGMDPATAAIVWPIVASTVGGAAKGIFTPQGQRLTSYEGGPNDPNAMLSEVHNLLGGVFNGVLNRAQSPIDMSDAVVQGGLPTFTGGALPMPIGITGGGKPAMSASAPGAAAPPSSPSTSLFSGQSPLKFTPTPIALPKAPAPDIGDASGAGQGGHSDTPGNNYQPLGHGLSDGLNTALNFTPEGADPNLTSGAGGNQTSLGGPVRKLSGMGMDSNTMNGGSAGGDDPTGLGIPTNDSTRAIGAVSLLLHLAQGGDQQFAQGRSA